MTNGTVILLGNLPVEPRLLGALAEEFGWSVEAAINLDHLERLGQDRNIVAILLDPQDMGEDWSGTLRSVRASTPEALPVVCQRFSEQIPWPELAEAGAFHMLALPLDPGELRQSLGFVWAARKQHLMNVVRLDRAARERVSRSRREVTPAGIVA